MVEKAVKLSSVEIINQLLASKSLARRRNLKGVCASRRSDEDLSDISDAEVGGYLNNKTEYRLKKIAWEMMNPEYQKGTWRKPTTGKKKDPTNKIAPSKKTSATRTKSNAETENKKRPSVEINFDVLDELFDTEKSPKRAKSEKPEVVSDRTKYSEKSSEESVLKPQGSEEEEEEEEELDWNKDYSNEDAYRGAKEFYGDEDQEFDDQDEGEDDEGIIW